MVGENRGLEFHLCDAVTVRVANVDRAERRIDFELIKSAKYDANESAE